MDWKKFAAGLTAGLLLYLDVAACAAQSVLPPEAPKDIKHILGFYYGNGENILVRENRGKLELLYRFKQEDKSFGGSVIYPLEKEHFDAYILHEKGPMSSSEANVRFERDSDGYGIACRVGGHTYSRQFLGYGVGERGAQFKFPPRSVEEWSALRQQAQEAQMPQQLGEGRRAELVCADTVTGLLIDSRYGSPDNCFSMPLYASEKLYIAKEAALALQQAEKQLESYGFGLVLWDAYRSWAVSKLAHLALPEKLKGMLPDPEKEGSSHNTGSAVDVSLYELESGRQAEMPSDFDEPSFRQYASYPGGTSRQRYLLALLRQIMELNGFKASEGEWWHFDYLPAEKWAHLNIEPEA